MPFDEPIALPCTLSRGGFSSERVFRVATAEGETYVGAAPVGYCYTPQGAPLLPGQAEAGKPIPGLIAARKIDEEEGGTFLVSVPDGGVFSVQSDAVRQRPMGAAS